MLKSIAALVAFCAAACGQTLLDQDLIYGLNLHNRVIASHSVVSEGEAVERLRGVFYRLAASGIARSGPVQGYQVFYLRSPAIQAAATAGGRMYVTEGLVNAVRGDTGILAFVMGHEIAHLVRQHGIRKYLRALQRQAYITELQYRARMGDKQANWELVGYVAANRLAEQKIERDEEHEADRLGLLMGAQAGYHPASAILAARTLRDHVGEQSKFMAFFSDHPRWETREQRAEQNYADAIQVYRATWGNGELSPGGEPPLLVSTGKMSAQRGNRQFDIAVPVTARNVHGPVRVALIAAGEHGEFPLVLQERQFVADAAESLSAVIPDSDLRGRKGKQFVFVTAAQDGKTVYETPRLRFK
jgi:Zn-dependent protease with chaperone function